MDITFSEILPAILVVAVPTVIGYFLGRNFSPTWLGLVLSLLWLPLLFFVCPRDSRATVFGVIFVSLIPTVVGFSVGVAKRPLKPNE
jgi:hypothetical protein